MLNARFSLSATATILLREERVFCLRVIYTESILAI